MTIRWLEWKTRLMTANGRSTKERTLLIARFLRLSIWDELQRQLDEQGYSIKRGTIQDASIITSVLVMLRQINPGVMPQRPGEAGMDHG